jgi:hypothetical protein
MRFQTPQFIDVEDKIFGPLTFKQFVYLVGGAGLIFIFWKLLPLFVAVILIVPAAIFAGALAFYKVNNKPFINVLQAGFSYFSGPKLYIWKKSPPKISSSKEVSAPVAPEYVPKLSDSKLKDISWSLGIEDSIYAGQKENQRGQGIIDTDMLA